VTLSYFAGTSTIALNVSVAMSKLPNANVLLSDFDLNSGMVRFMLKLDNSYCVTDAAEHSLRRCGVVANGLLGHAYGRAGDRESALKMAAQLTQQPAGKYVSPYNLALIYAGLGETDKTLELLNEACEHRSLFLAWLNVEPMFESVRADPRFAKLVKRIGLKSKPVPPA
jgi:Mrp family chromosome partitioning ATPase